MTSNHGILYYRRDGTPYSMLEWARDFEDISLKSVARTILSDGKVVSTVWLGLNHNFGEGPPLIFETMVFPSVDDFSDLDMDRYSTEEEALKGHDRMVKKWTGERE